IAPGQLTRKRAAYGGRAGHSLCEPVFHYALERGACGWRSGFGRSAAGVGAALPRLLVPHLRVYPQTRSFSRGIAGSNAAVFRDLSGKELRGQGCAGTGAFPDFSDELGAELSAQRARPGAGPKTRRWKDLAVSGPDR